MQDIEAAQKSISKALVVAMTSKSQQRGKYNSYSLEQRAKIGRFFAENGPTWAARHFTAVWDINVNEATARRLKSKYLDKLRDLKQRSQEDSNGKPIAVTMLETKYRG